MSLLINPYVYPTILRDGLQLHLDAGDIASWPGSGQTWNDIAGNGFQFHLGSGSGADSADPTFNGSPGGHSAAEYWSFDGGDYFTQAAAYSGSLMRSIGRTDQPFTVEAWLWRGAATNVSDALFASASMGAHSGCWVEFARSTDNLPRIQVYPLSSGVTASGAIAGGAWKHVVWAGRCNGSTGSFYTNAAANGTWSLNNSSFTSGDSSITPTLCAYGGGSTPVQNGTRLAIVRMYSRVLSAGEVLHNFTAERGRFGV